MQDDTQLEDLIPKLKSAFKNATGGTGKAKDLNFANLQAELDVISRENVLKFNTPPFFTIIVRSLTILEGLAISVDPNFRLVKGAYPFVLSLLLSREGECPEELKKLLVSLLTVEGGKKINWARLNKFLNLAASSEGGKRDKGKVRVSYGVEGEGEFTSYELFGKVRKLYLIARAEKHKLSACVKKSAKKFALFVTTHLTSHLSSSPHFASPHPPIITLSLHLQFLTSDAGLILKEPLIQEIAATIDGLVSKQEKIVFKMSNELLRVPGGMGPVDETRTVFLERMLAVVLDNVDRDGVGGIRDVLVEVSE